MTSVSPTIRSKTLKPPNSSQLRVETDFSRQFSHLKTPQGNSEGIKSPQTVLGSALIKDRSYLSPLSSSIKSIKQKTNTNIADFPEEDAVISDSPSKNDSLQRADASPITKKLIQARAGAVSFPQLPHNNDESSLIRLRETKGTSKNTKSFNVIPSHSKQIPVDRLISFPSDYFGDHRPSNASGFFSFRSFVSGNIDSHEAFDPLKNKEKVIMQKVLKNNKEKTERIREYIDKKFLDVHNNVVLSKRRKSEAEKTRAKRVPIKILPSRHSDEPKMSFIERVLLEDEIQEKILRSQRLDSRNDFSLIEDSKPFKHLESRRSSKNDGFKPKNFRFFHHSGILPKMNSPQVPLIPEAREHATFVNFEGKAFLFGGNNSTSTQFTLSLDLSNQESIQELKDSGFLIVSICVLDEKGFVGMKRHESVE